MSERDPQSKHTATSDCGHDEGPPAQIWIRVQARKVRVVGDVFIGRASDCEIVLNDLLVSRQHACIAMIAGECAIEDLGSTTGTFLNGSRIQQSVLHPGDRIVVGTTELEIVGYHPDSSTPTLVPPGGTYPPFEMRERKL